MPGPWLNLVVAGRNLRLGKAREQLVDQRLTDTATATDNEDLFGFRAQARPLKVKRLKMHGCITQRIPRRINPGADRLQVGCGDQSASRCP
jgi:hypothetical protein